VLQHNGTINGSSRELTINVTPGSGTGKLEGISGTMSIKIAPDGKHFCVFEYLSDDGHFHLGLFPYPAYQQLDITAAGTPEVGKAELVSGNFYEQMQVKPQMGRPIESADDGAPSAGTVAVISGQLLASRIRRSTALCASEAVRRKVVAGRSSPCFYPSTP
jgi:hypothetical protein